MGSKNYWSLFPKEAFFSLFTFI